MTTANTTTTTTITTDCTSTTFKSSMTVNAIIVSSHTITNNTTATTLVRFTLDDQKYVDSQISATCESESMDINLLLSTDSTHLVSVSPPDVGNPAAEICSHSDTIALEG